MFRKPTRIFTLLALPLVLLLAAPGQAWGAKKVLRLRVDGPVNEAPSQQQAMFSALAGETTKTLYDWVHTIRQAADDPEIAGLVLIVEQPAMSLAQAEEMLEAMQAFRDTGRPIYAYMDYGTNLTYLLASGADHVTLAETSDLFITGLQASLMFYKGLMDKLGIEAELLHCGAYKSAVEPFTRTEPSPEAAENINWLLDGLFEQWVQRIAKNRGLKPESVRAAIDAAPLPAKQALEMKLVDEVSSFPAFKRRIRKEFGQDVEIIKRIKKEDELEIDFSNPFAIFELFGKMVEKADQPKEPGLAVVYIEGGIVVGSSEPSLFGGSTSAGSNTLRAAFEKIRQDDKIKGVVVRVNSPGGSALASDIMWEAATRLAQEKPLVVSMSGVAASGGYYVSLPGDLIFVDATTITGSIGVLGGKFVWKGLMEEKLGITTAEFSRGAHAGLFTPNRNWTEAERAFMQSYLDAIYAQFKGRVMQSRGDRLKGDLEDLAGGRVFTGRQAIEHGLADRLGGLVDALDYLADKTGLGKDYKVYHYPEEKDVFEQLFAELLGQETEDDWEITLGRGLTGSPLERAIWPLLQHLAPEQARVVRGDLMNLLILQKERVGCFVPWSLRPR